MGFEGPSCLDGTMGSNGKITMTQNVHMVIWQDILMVCSQDLMGFKWHFMGFNGYPLVRLWEIMVHNSIKQCFIVDHTWRSLDITSGRGLHNYGKIHLFLMGKLTISMAMFNTYVINTLPGGNWLSWWFRMWFKQCHKPAMTGNGSHSTYVSGWLMIVFIALVGRRFAEWLRHV